MATICITFATDNAAFEDDLIGEVARIVKHAGVLACAAIDQTDLDTSMKLRDSNGNTVGSVEVTE